MNRMRMLLGSVALMILGLVTVAISLPASRPRSSYNHQHADIAEEAIRAEILGRFPDPSGQTERYFRRFSRSADDVKMRIKSQYTMALTEHAPEGMNATPSCAPFEIYEAPAYTDAEPPVLFFGYCEITFTPLPPVGDMLSVSIKTTVYLYVADEMKYVVAAEHPFIKARLSASAR
jgi:hypothetical protein